MKKLYSLLLVVLVAFVLVGCGPKVTITIHDADKELTIEEGTKDTVTPVVEGEAVLVWESSDPSIATVADGEITAIKPGTATITVYVQDNKEISATIALTVTAKLINYYIGLTETEIELTEGEEKTLTPTANKEATLVWETSNAQVATVEGGKVTAVKAGEAKVTVYIQEKPELKKEVKVVVVEKVYNAESVSVNLERASISIGEIVNVTASVNPAEALQDVDWSFTPSENVSFEDGKITALAAGNVTVRATAKDGSLVYGETTLRIYNVVQDFTIEGKTNMKLNEQQLLNIVVATENTKEDFVWTSSDETIATVDEIGFVTALKEGTVTIKAVANDSGKVSKTITITIKEDKLAIGNTVYNTLAEALAAAKEGDTITLPAGNYDDAFTISINNLTILGPNAGVNPAKVNRSDEAIFGGKITIAKGVKGVTIDGCIFNGSGAVTLEEDVSDFTVQYCGYGKTSQDGVVRGPASGTVTNIKMNYNFSDGFSSYRFGHFNATLDGLEMIGNELTCTSCYDMLNVAGVLKGKVVIKDNKFINSLQSFLYVKGVGIMDCTIEGNYVEAAANTIIDFRDMKEDGAVQVVISNNEFKDAGAGWMPIRIRTAGYDSNDTLVINVYDNKFIETYCVATVPEFMNNPSYDSQTDPFKAIYVVGKNYYEVDGKAYTNVTADNFRGSAISIEPAYATSAEVPGFDNSEDILPTSITVTNKISQMEAFSSYKIEFAIGPDNATNTKVAYLSSDNSVATVTSAGLINSRSSGTCTITVYSLADSSVKDEFTITVSPKERIEIRYEGTGVLEIGKTLNLESTYYGSTYENENITYTSSDVNIATVDSMGGIKAKAAGQVTITATIGTLEAKVSVTIVDNIANMNKLLQLLIGGNNGVVLRQNVMYIGSDDGSADFEHTVYGSVNDYYAGTAPSVTRNMLSTTAANYDGRKMKSIEFIVFHDTAGSGSGSTAAANSGWCNNPTNTGSSWHYTIGNDGIYQQVEDDIVTWHAGDGANWAESTTLYDTGIAADPNLRNRAKVTLGADGYFYVNGQKSKVLMPAGATVATGMNTLGVAAVVKDGNYYIPTTHVGSSYGQVVCIRGGNLNGIGIESAVNSGSDVYLTWQYSAKFIAQLLIKHNMTPERVLFHNNFSNKPCPRTMMTADLVETFLDLVYMEYEIAKNYSDYTITFTSHNPEILDNTGRIVSYPKLTTNVSYTITVTKGNETQSVTLNSLIIGQYN